MFLLDQSFAAQKKLRLVWFYMTKRFHYNATPLASLGRRQMYGGKKTLFSLTPNCCAYSHHSKEIVSHHADFPFGKVTPPWFELALS